MYKQLIAPALIAGALVVAAPAQADVLYDIAICPSGHSGVASGVTSCAFADNVRQAYYAQSGPEVVAYSPVTGQVYDMFCSPNTTYFTNGLVLPTILCQGGSSARVVIF